MPDILADSLELSLVQGIAANFQGAAGRAPLDGKCSLNAVPVPGFP
jgi:hypothetical protein